MNLLPISRRGLLAALAIAACAGTAPAAWADGLDSLERFIKTVRSGRASFTQVVTSPPKEGQKARSKTSTGVFEFQRPGRFRFLYRKPFEQTLVADGQTLWLYDADLNQVTARDQAKTLGSTPAALVASAADLKSLQADFQLKAEPDQDGLQWVRATPKTRDGQLQHIRVGLRQTAAAPQLETLEILDSFGQRSVMRFADFELNPALPAEIFRFKAPAGADVVRQ